MRLPKDMYRAIRPPGTQPKTPVVLFGESENGYIDPASLDAETLAQALNAAYRRGCGDGAKYAAEAFKLIGLHIASDYDGTRADGTTLIDDALAIVEELRGCR